MKLVAYGRWGSRMSLPKIPGDQGRIIWAGVGVALSRQLYGVAMAPRDYLPVAARITVQLSLREAQRVTDRAIYCVLFPWSC